MITYFDTSVLLKLLVNDEPGRPETERLWLACDHALCAEIGFAEARAALASARRSGRLTPARLRTAKAQLDDVWDQVDVVVVDNALVRSAGDLAEAERLRGYDAVHLAAALAGQATIFASADGDLVAAALRRRLNVANPIKPTPEGHSRR